MGNSPLTGKEACPSGEAMGRQRFPAGVWPVRQGMGPMASRWSGDLRPAWSRPAPRRGRKVFRYSPQGVLFHEKPELIKLDFRQAKRDYRAGQLFGAEFTDLAYIIIYRFGANPKLPGYVSDPDTTR